MHVLRSHRPMVASSSRWVAAVLVGWMAAIGAGGVDGGHMGAPHAPCCPPPLPPRF